MDVNKDIKKMTLNKNDIVIIRYPHNVTEEYLIRSVQQAAETINDSSRDYINPVIFLNEDLGIEKISIDQLEEILKQAKAIRDTGYPDQEETEIVDEELQANLEAEQKFKGLMDDLVPDEYKRD